jgi:hypothetical protein
MGGLGVKADCKVPSPNFIIRRSILGILGIDMLI